MLRRKKIRGLPPVVIHKWSATVIDEGFVPFPKRLLRCLGQIFTGENAIDDLRVVLSVVDYDRPDLVRPPSYEYLAFNAGLSVARFKERVEAMAQCGLLTVAGVDEAIEINLSGLRGIIVELTEDEDRPGETSALS